jgi:hypothetical protein
MFSDRPIDLPPTKMSFRSMVHAMTGKSYFNEVGQQSKASSVTEPGEKKKREKRRKKKKRNMLEKAGLF